jgi:hypothetical protein
MDIQMIHHQMPARDLWSVFHQPFQMHDTILLTTRGTPGWFNDPSGSDIEVDIPGERSMPDIFKFPP